MTICLDDKFLPDRGELGATGMTSSRSTRRWASLRQHVTSGDGIKPSVELLLNREQISKSQTPSSQPHSPNTPRTPHTPLKKSNWEVIEHFTGAPRPSIVTMGLGSEIGVSLAAGGVKEPISVTAINASFTENERKCALSRFLRALCRSHRFKNLQTLFVPRKKFSQEIFEIIRHVSRFFPSAARDPSVSTISPLT
ncbi:hypothetical protein KQX54_019371 [Cotesia glomerata]|uniref:Uncharacterized protein n=1 Tax=Cotesia glomerata TaxID=32391 RepID=A0AAV7IFD3_COTGL|nr:hypothetical protein KQX54_019371 [Cotesia glomerata]